MTRVKRKVGSDNNNNSLHGRANDWVLPSSKRNLEIHFGEKERNQEKFKPEVAKSLSRCC